MADVSVIIPCFNRAPFIGATLRSIHEQTEPVREVLVVDDGSTDGSPQVVEQVVRETGLAARVIYQGNLGPSAARNQGLRQAQGAMIAFLDADDLWMPDKIMRQVAALRTPDAKGRRPGAVYCRMFKFRATLDDLGWEEPQNFVDAPEWEHILRTMCVQSSTALVRRDVMEDLWFDESIRAAEDALYFTQVARRTTWRMVDEPLVAYRVHGNQLTHTADHAFATTEARVNWVRAQAGTLGAKAAALEKQLWADLVMQVEKAYWRREVAGLTRQINKLRELCPGQLDESFLATARIYPKWVYRVRDCFSRK